MKIRIDDEVASRPELRDIVMRANEVLQKALRRAPHPPMGEWKLSANEDLGKPVELKLDYFDQTLTTAFSLDELSDLDRLFYRLLRIWGRLIVQDVRAAGERIVKTLGELRDGLREEEQAAVQQ